MKTKDIIRLTIWGLLFICCFIFGIIGIVNKKINRTQSDEPTPEIIYNDEYPEIIE